MSAATSTRRNGTASTAVWWNKAVFPNDRQGESAAPPALFFSDFDSEWVLYFPAIAGGTISMMMAPTHRRTDTRKMLSRALKGMGDVIEDVSGVFGR